MARSHSALESSSSSSRESSPSDGPRRHVPPDNEPVPRSNVQSDTWDIRKVDSEMKYRLWFTWHLVEISLIDVDLAEVARRHEMFWSCVSGTDPNEDLWFWEDEDEQYIQTFTNDWDLHLGVSEVEWADSCRALEARQLQHSHPRTPSPVSHLTPQTRLRFLAWLILANAHLKERGSAWTCMGTGTGLDDLIKSWQHFVIIDSNGFGLTRTPECHHCRVSFMNIWLETMLQVYSIDDLQSIPWDQQCTCFPDALAAHSEQRPALKIRPERDSAILRVIFEFVVPLWPLILWVAFRTLAKDQPYPLETFLDILRGLDHNLFTWDLDDYHHLLKILYNYNDSLGLYPQDWNRYMVEIDFKTWMEIRNTTKTAERLRFGSSEVDLQIRISAASLLFSNALGVPHNIHAPLNVAVYRFPFTVIAQVVNPAYQKHSASNNFESKEFWTGPNLEKWLSARGQDLCHSIWQTCSHMTTLERLKAMHFVLTGSHKESGRRDAASLLHLGFLGSPTGFKSLFVKLLNDGKRSMENGSGSTHPTPRGIYRHMDLCLSVAVVGLVLVLQDRDSYHEFLTYRGTDAQRLLDSLQDFLDLDSFSVVKPPICKALLRLSHASGLYPQCFTLTGLQKVGQQVNGGGFGDIWKGLVHGHSVCLKIMRIFQNDCIEDLLKEFSREALIWRQLCHPNLLPFFGLYYHDLDNRLCLVSPWMENGNVVEFLRKQFPDVDRLSLILDVALGLEYLHNRKVVHGDLKGINILITPSRRACIADFGLSSIVNAMTVQLTISTVPTRGGTARYQAPELFEGGNSNSFASDVYGFACVCYEILTGSVPFYELRNDMAVMLSVMRGERPSGPPPGWTGLHTSVLDGLWELLQNCWDGQAENRPTAFQIAWRLVGPPISATTTSCETDWDHKFTSKFRRSLQAQPLLPSTQIEGMFFRNGLLDSFNVEEAEARKESFLDQGSSAPQNTEDSPERGRRSKRPYREKMAGPSSDDDPGTGSPTAKRWKPSPEIIDLTLED